MRNEDGAILIGDQQVASTRQCKHCGSHEVCVPGSGKERGVCLKCGGFVCGRPECMTACIPFEAWLDHKAGKQTKYAEQIIEREQSLEAAYRAERLAREGLIVGE